MSIQETVLEIFLFLKCLKNIWYRIFKDKKINDIESYVRIIDALFKCNAALMTFHICTHFLGYWDSKIVQNLTIAFFCSRKIAKLMTLKKCSIQIYFTISDIIQALYPYHSQRYIRTNYKDTRMMSFITLYELGLIKVSKFALCN